MPNSKRSLSTINGKWEKLSINAIYLLRELVQPLSWILKNQTITSRRRSWSVDVLSLNVKIYCKNISMLWRRSYFLCKNNDQENAKTVKQNSPPLSHFSIHFWLHFSGSRVESKSSIRWHFFVIRDLGKSLIISVFSFHGIDITLKTRHDLIIVGTKNIFLELDCLSTTVVIVLF